MCIGEYGNQSAQRRSAPKGRFACEEPTLFVHRKGTQKGVP